MSIILDPAVSTTDDALYVVQRNEQDQYVRLLNLDDPNTIFKARDTFKPTIAGRQPVTVQAEHRRGAATMVAERRDTGSVGGTFMVKGATADEALARAESLLAQADSAGRDRFLWWQPVGASFPSLYPLLGPGAATVNWTFPMFASGYVPIDVTWATQSWTEEPVMDFSDDFRNRHAASSLAQFQEDWTSTVTPSSVTQGSVELPVQNLTNTAKVAHLGRRPWQDGWVTVKGRAKTGAASSALAVTPGVRYSVATGGYFFAALNGGNLVVYEWNGSLNSRATVAQAAPAVGTDHWLRVRAAGTSVTAEYWASLPTPHGTPTSTVTYTNAATLRSGYPLLTSYGMAAGAANISVVAGVDSRPFSYRLVNTPATVALPQIPGTMEALADIDLTPATTDSDYPRHLLLSWRRALAGSAPSGSKATVIQAESWTAIGGDVTVTVHTDATALRGASGQGAKSTVTALGGLTYAHYLFDPTIFEADAFSDEVTVAIFARYVRETGIVAPRLVSFMVTEADTANRYTPELGSTGRYLPLQGSGARSTFLGTLSLPLRSQRAITLGWAFYWAAGSTAGQSVYVDELYVSPVASLALGAVGKNRDDGTYSPLVAANGHQRRVHSNLGGSAANWATGNGWLFSKPLNMGGAPIQLPTNSEGVELLVRPSVGVPDDPVSTATDILAHNVTVHARVTPRHHLFAA